MTTPTTPATTDWPALVLRLLADRAWSQTRLARRLGVRPATVSDWCRGRHAPTGAAARALRELDAEGAA